MHGVSCDFYALNADCLSGLVAAALHFLGASPSSCPVVLGPAFECGQCPCASSDLGFQACISPPPQPRTAESSSTSQHPGKGRVSISCPAAEAAPQIRAAPDIQLHQVAPLAMQLHSYSRRKGVFFLNQNAFSNGAFHLSDLHNYMPLDFLLLTVLTLAKKSSEAF